MKRAVFLAVALAALGAAFAAGQATAPGMKFPYAGAMLNGPCGRTELEWRCATAGIRSDKVVPAGIYWTIRSLCAEPRAKGLVVRANVELQADKVITDKRDALENGCWRAYEYALDHFGHGRGKGKPMTQWQNIAIYLSVNGKPAMVGVGGNFQEVSQFPK